MSNVDRTTRMPRCVVLAVLLAVWTVLISACSDSPAVTVYTSPSSVVYEVISSIGKATRLTYTSAAGQIDSTEVVLPWQMEDYGIASPAVSATNAGDGDITCTIYIDHKTASTVTASGEFATAHCAVPVRASGVR